MMRILGFLAATLFVTSAVAAPRKIDDCEAIAEPMAYNACLASFGPTRGLHAVGAELGGSNAKVAHSRRGAGAKSRHATGGRIQMEFTPKGR